MFRLLAGAAMGALVPGAPAAAAPPVLAVTTVVEKVPVPPVRAEGSLPGLFSTDDYPVEALFNGETGTVAFGIEIDRDGRVTQCAVETSSGSPSLDRTTCEIIKRRARFTPARDARGRATEDRSIGRISWQLPEPELVMVEDSKEGLVYSFTQSGKVDECLSEGKLDAAERGKLCDYFRARVSELADAARPSGSLVKKQVAIEFGQLVGGIESARFVGRGSGEWLGSLIAVALTIDATGTVTDCRPADGNTEDDEAKIWCENSVKGRYFPLDASAVDRSERHLVTYQAVYIRPTR
jgi:TonB family protein